MKKQMLKNPGSFSTHRHFGSNYLFSPPNQKSMENFSNQNNFSAINRFRCSLRRLFTILSIVTIILSSYGTVEGQVLYTQNWNAVTNTAGWSTNWASTTSLVCEGARAVRKNIFSAGTAGAFVSPLLGTSNGALVNMSFQYKITNWSAGTVATPNTFGTIQVQYGPTATGPWTTALTINNTNHTPSTACATRNLSFTPAAGNLYVRFNCLYGAGDYWMYFDNVNITQSAGVPCSGTPAPGNTISSSASVAPGGTVNLSLQNATSGSGVTYQWQSSTTGGAPWTNFGTSSPTQTSPIISASIWFRCLVTCSGSTGTSNPVQVIPSYCTPSGTGANSYITNFVTTGGVSNISNASAFTAGGYANYSSTISCSQSAGSNVNFTLSYISDPGIKIFIDWNNDLDFNDVGENVYSSNAYVLSSVSGTIAVPAGQPVGNYRMRIVADWNSTAPVSCPVSINGETEDYTFTVTTPPACTAPISLVSSTVTSTTATISWTAATPAPASGYQYFVSSSATAPNAGTTPSGSTAAGVTNANLSGLTANTTYYFWVRSNCGGSGTSAWAGSSNFFTGYCQPTGTGVSSYISNFVTTGGVTNISNASGLTAGGYANYASSLSCSQYANSTVNFTLSYTGDPGTKIFIDWNNDLDFNDVGENVYSSNGYFFTSVSGTITVPAGQAVGNYRMRIVADYNSTTPVACPLNINGETEDYTFAVALLVPCAGTPNPGATTATSSQVFAGGSTTLGFTTAQTGTGISYQWQSGPSATGPWTTIGGATSATYVASPTVETYYQCVVTCFASGATGISTPIQISVNPYCEPVYIIGKTDGDLISNISISGTTLLNISGTTQVNPSYTLFSGQPNYTANLVAANSYNVTVTVGTWGTQGIAAWIDYNDNNVFEASEKIGNTAGTIGTGTGGSPIPANHTASFTINLSCTPALGTHRMRVRDVYNVAGPLIDPCATYTYGETEDYFITIVPGAAFTPTITSPTTSCVGSQVTYELPVGQTNYSWIPSGISGTDYTINSGGISTSNTMIITWLTSGNKTVNFDYASPLGCPSSGVQTSSAINFGMGTFATTPNNGDVVWRGSSSTDWATPSNWYAFNSGSYSVAGAAPNNLTRTIIPVNTCIIAQPLVALGATVNAKDVVIETGASLTMSTGTLNVAGNFTINGSGTFTPGTGTVNFMAPNNTSQVISMGTNPSNAFYNLSINAASLPDVNPSVELTANTTVNGNYTNNSGSLKMNNFNFTVGGNYANFVNFNGYDDGIVQGSGSVIFNRPSLVQTLYQEPGLDFSTIEHTGAGVLQLNSDLSASGDIINTAGTFNGGSNVITVRGNLTNTALFISNQEIIFEKNGGTQTLSAGSGVGGSFSMFEKIVHQIPSAGSASTLNINGLVEVKGDVVIDAPISTGTAGTSSFKFTGTVNQTITGTQPLVALNDMLVNKPSGNLILSKPVRVNNALTMTQGIIETDATNKLEIGSSTSSLGSVNWTGGTVVGPMRRWFAGAANSTPESGMFPVGLSTVNRYAQVNFTAAPGSGGYIDMAYVAGAPANASSWTNLTSPDGQLIQTFEDEGYWDITPYDASGNAYPSGLNTSAFTLKLRANGLTTVNDISVTRIIRSPGPAHTTWVPAGFHVAPTGPTNDFVIQSNTVTGFSWFNIGSPNSSPLPVELTSFTGTCDDGKSVIEWNTASEHNSSHFDLEESRDGENWQLLSTLGAAGNSNSELNYQVIDNNVNAGDNYYRLLQYDNDGVSKVYGPINVSCAEVVKGYFSSFPNPSGNTFQVVVNNKDLQGSGVLHVVDSKGVEVSKTQVELKDGINMYVVNETLAPGIYFISITNGTKTTEVIRHAVK